MFQKNKLLSMILLVVVFAASGAFAQTSIYLYNEKVSDDVDIGAYLQDGEVVVLDWDGLDSGPYIVAAPAPDPYPHVHVWEKGVEQLGPSDNEMNGIRFVNHGTHFVKNRQAVIVWMIEIPSASERFGSEFSEDLTLSLWIDWNNDGVWNPSEKMVHEHVNLHDYMPTGDETVKVLYMTKFQVPAVEEMLVNSKAGDADRDVINLWARGIVSYDDPDVSPDGEQIFGEVEDYRLRYMMTPRGKKEL
ncbi:MAG: GEVED domain-containing protein [bacterium]